MTGRAGSININLALEAETASCFAPSAWGLVSWTGLNMRRLMLFASASMVGLSGISSAAPLPDGSVLIITPMADMSNHARAERVSLQFGTEYRTPDSGSLELVFANGASVRLSERSGVTIAAGEEPDAGPVLAFTSGSGGAYILTPETASAGVRVQTPGGLMTTRAGGAFVELDGPQTMVAAAWGQPVRLQDRDRSVEIQPGKQLTLDGNTGARTVGPIESLPVGMTVDTRQLVYDATVVQTAELPSGESAATSLPTSLDLLGRSSTPDESSILSDASILGPRSIGMLASVDVLQSTPVNIGYYTFTDSNGISYEYIESDANLNFYKNTINGVSTSVANYSGTFTYTAKFGSSGIGTLTVTVNIGAETASVQVVAGGVTYFGTGFAIYPQVGPLITGGGNYFPVKLGSSTPSNSINAYGSFGGPENNGVIFDLSSATFQIGDVEYTGSGQALLIVNGFVLGAPAFDLSYLPTSGVANFSGPFSLTSGAMAGATGTLNTAVNFGARTATTQIAVAGLAFSGTNSVPISGPAFPLSLTANVAGTSLQGIGYFVPSISSVGDYAYVPTTNPILQVRANILKGGTVIASGSGTGK